MTSSWPEVSGVLCHSGRLAQEVVSAWRPLSGKFRLPFPIRFGGSSRAAHDLIAEPFDHRCARIIETEIGDKVPFAAWYGILMS